MRLGTAYAALGRPIKPGDNEEFAAKFVPTLVIPRLDRGTQMPPDMPMPGYVYILASQRNGTLYTGVTSDLHRRLLQHRIGDGSEFVRRYGVTRLVYLEEHAMVAQAIRREKRLKHWPRQWKLDLIEGLNPEWRDLTDDLT